MKEEINLVIETKEGIKVTKRITCPICNKTVFCLIDDEENYNPETHDEQCTIIYKKKRGKE